MQLTGEQAVLAAILQLDRVGAAGQPLVCELCGCRQGGAGRRVRTRRRFGLATTDVGPLHAPRASRPANPARCRHTNSLAMLRAASRSATCSTWAMAACNVQVAGVTARTRLPGC